jgi:NAD(P)-dependent dehydrogenase (short-subunit alcohol dehydrogenase family)
VSDENDVKDAFNFINKKTNHIYGLVNNAGINPSRNDILNTSLADWEDTINTNLKGAFLCSKQAIKSMKKNSKGAIVNISSVAAFGMKKRVAYSSSKAGMIGFTKSLARDHASKNIRVNCICPGYVPTNLVKSYLNNLSAKEKKDLFDRHPMGKLGSPEDIAFATSFLLSNRAKWITGIALNVDGGYSIF